LIELKPQLKTHRKIVASITVLIVVLVTGISIVLFNKSANAIDPSKWDAGRIIDDNVFTNYNSMNAQQIQSFLLSKVPNCDTDGSRGSTPTSRRDYFISKGYPLPIKCLTNFTENGKTAAQIIYDAAQEFHINPQVILVLLEKEQNLVTDDWPDPTQWASATGYGCPDSTPGVCESTYRGFTNQVRWAANMFRAIMNNSPTWYTPYVLGNNYIMYNPSPSCGGSIVNIENRATQALYNYTPYQPNQAALSANWGSAPCGAYGNRNFYLYFSNWFGSPTGSATYGYSVVSKTAYSDSNYQSEIASPLNVEPNTEIYIKLKIKNTGNQVWYKDTLRLGTENPKERSSVFVDSWLSHSRPALMDESSVGEGETATFTFKLKAPSALGSYQESFGVLIENQRWLDGVCTIPIVVSSKNPYYLIQPVSFEAYKDQAMSNKLDTNNISSYTNSKIYIKTVIKNSGNQTLPSGITQVATADPLDHNSTFSDSSWLSKSRASKAQAGDIAPQKTGTFVFSITTPSSPIAKTTEKFGLVIEGQRWLSDDIGQISIQTSPLPPVVLNANEVLETNKSLLSSDGKYILVLQGDGNLVLYSPTRAIWASWTVGTGASKLVMQSDGNLVLYRSDWTPVWDSHSGGKGSSRLIIQPDGNLVVYAQPWNATWYTATQSQQ
jgi:hypothetical protein